jgi:dTDP-3-amino-2,3,6-trideoxy-4-keto-D-glucose/dTDP-3-amino-3,4,6-trideoxy-alpha-D-glucose/dTDP-2,6-dideoxy-D-kanosamine transaminase
MHVRYSPLGQQFAEPDKIFDDIRALVASGDFTLGRVVSEFETRFAEMLGVKHAIGVGSGTDSLKLPLKALGLGPGDEVITSANTFYATVGAIAEVGATPVFVDCDDTFCIDVDLIAAAITPRTKALMPVHLTGDVANMTEIMALAQQHGIPVVEDACQSLLGTHDGRLAGTFGIAAGFSMHPLKIINVWGDAGIVVTDDDEMNRKLRLLRNHGLVNRDEMEILGYNTRLDSLQAVVGKTILEQAPEIVRKRALNAAHYDAGFAQIPQITIPPRNQGSTHVFLLYVLFAKQRDALVEYCLEAGIEAKVHYPIPLYQQKALAFLDHKPGDFPVADRHAVDVISFPVDQHLSKDEMDYVVATVRKFYEGE